MKSYFLIIAAFFLIPKTVFAQADSTTVQYTEENASSSDFNLKETYNYLIRAQVEEKTLIKLGINSFGLGGSGSHIIHASLTYGVGLEQKIKPSFSVLAEFRHTLQYIDTKFIDPNTPRFNRPYSFNVGARYYYNIDARIRKGKSANNFSANYLGIFQQNMFAREKATNNFYYSSNINLLYGLQRRIGKYGFVDFGVGPVLGHRPGEKARISLNMLFSIGIAF